MPQSKNPEDSLENRFDRQTLLLHLDRLRGKLPNGALFEQKFASVAYEFSTTDEIEAVYQGRVKGIPYGRQGSPTSTSLEARLTSLEGGRGTVCFSTGMAAYDALFATILRSGDHIIASQYLFSNTVSLLNSYRDRFQVGVDYVDVSEVDHVANVIRPSTVAVIVETVANPKTQIPDLSGIGMLLEGKGIAYIVDNTVTTPWAFCPASIGAAVSINSLTKSIGGHGRALGGAVTDTGQFDWPSSRIYVEERFRDQGPLAYLTQLRKKGLRDKGATLSSGDAASISMGLETLPLRIKAASDNAMAIAETLERCPWISGVHYPGLPSHPQHKIAARHFKHFGPLLSFELAPPVDPTVFLNKLRLVVRSSSLGDNRTLAIAVARTIFHEVGASVREMMGIPDGLVRMSVGIESPHDILNDLTQAAS